MNKTITKTRAQEIIDRLSNKELSFPIKFDTVADKLDIGSCGIVSPLKLLNLWLDCGITLSLQDILESKPKRWNKLFLYLNEVV